MEYLVIVININSVIKYIMAYFYPHDLKVQGFHLKFKCDDIDKLMNINRKKILTFKLL